MHSNKKRNKNDATQQETLLTRHQKHPTKTTTQRPNNHLNAIWTHSLVRLTGATRWCDSHQRASRTMHDEKLKAFLYVRKRSGKSVMTMIQQKL